MIWLEEEKWVSRGESIGPMGLAVLRELFSMPEILGPTVVIKARTYL